jgi:DNA-binding FadR family transcriptional regulator
VLAIGRGRLREAIRILSALGYVEVKHGGGMYLTAVPVPIIFQPVQTLVEFGISTQLELLQVRRMIEVETIAQAARTAGPSLLTQLKSIVDRLADGQLSVEELVKLDLSFHFAIVESTGNQTLLRMFAGLGSLLTSSLTDTLRLPGAQQRSFEEHQLLLSAIVAGNENSARKEMVKHLAVVEQRLRGGLDTERAPVP